VIGGIRHLSVLGRQNCSPPRAPISDATSLVTGPDSCPIKEVESVSLLSNFAVEFVDEFHVDPRYLKPVLVAQRSTTMVRHLRPVNADFQLKFRSVSLHGIHETFVERLRDDKNRYSKSTDNTLRISWQCMSRCRHIVYDKR